MCNEADTNALDMVKPCMPYLVKQEFDKLLLIFRMEIEFHFLKNGIDMPILNHFPLLRIVQVAEMIDKGRNRI